MNDEDPCPRCEHLNGEHQLLTFEDVRKGGAVVCRAADCTCIGTWAAGWDGHSGELPDFAVVVQQVRQWAEAMAWSEDRLIDTLARFERMRR